MRFWVFSRKARMRLTTFSALTLIAILVIMAATVVLQNPSLTGATAPENASSASAPGVDTGDANPLGP
jgi:hypothetical protein